MCKFVRVGNSFIFRSSFPTNQQVAPDVVMTAAHCEADIKYALVGSYYSTINDTSANANNEMFEVTGPTYTHPLYNSGVSFSYDVLLFKLNRNSKNQYIRINTDPNLPSASSSSIEQHDARNSNYNDISSQHKYANNLTVMGIGSTKFEKFGHNIPHVLQETTTSYVPNRVCRRAKDSSVDDNYQNLISDDMLCAFEDNQDACQGQCVNNFDEQMFTCNVRKMRAQTLLPYFKCIAR